MGDYSGIGRAIDATIKFSFGALCVSVPLAIWKLVDIAVWLYSNVQIEFG